MDLLTIQEDRAELLEKADAIVANAKTKSRDLTKKEAKDVDTLLAQHEKLGPAESEAALAEAQQRAKAAEQANSGRYGPPIYSGGNPPGLDREQRGYHVDSRQPRTEGLKFRDTGSGKIVAAIPSHEAMATERTEYGVGDIVAGVLRGDITPEIRAAVGGTDDRGGYLITEQVSRNIIDLARAASVTQRAGAQTLPISGDVRLVRVNQDPTSYWRSETEAITASDILFDSITLRPKMLACLVPVSLELLEDASNAPAIIQQTIANSMAAELDRVVLTGTGASNEPLGIRNHGSVNTQTSVGTPTTYATQTAAVGAILTDNYQGDIAGLSWIAHPRDWTTFDGLVTGIASDVSPLEATPWVRQLQRYSTTSLSITEGAGSNESSMIVGDFTQVLVGMRTNVQVQVLDSGTASDGSNTLNAVTEFRKFIRVYLRADVAVLRPTWFDVASGVTSA